jgi:hypothetical protein
VDREEPDRRGEDPDDGLGWLVGDEEPEEIEAAATPEPEPPTPASAPGTEPDVEPGRAGEPGAQPGASPEQGREAPVEPQPALAAIGREEPPGRSGARLLFLGLPLLFLLLVGWHHTVSSDRFCASCHAAQPATLSAARSVHAGVPCIQCHSGSGLAGSVAYVPTLLREGVASVTGFGGHGILPARPCSSCHPHLSPASHPDPNADCATCHGDVSHPTLQIPGAQPLIVDGKHPTGFIQVHGQRAIDQPKTCIACHQQKFCEACHLRETFPHPAGWISKHGAVQEQQGAAACTVCHGQTFCAGCHGTEIPHRPDWLAQHPVALQDASTQPCFTCHPQTDCTTCHSEHAVHNEQGLYTFPSPAQVSPTPARRTP